MAVERFWPTRRVVDGNDQLWVAVDHNAANANANNANVNDGESPNASSPTGNIITTANEVVMKLIPVSEDPVRRDQIELEAQALRRFSEMNPFRIVEFKGFYTNQEEQFVLVMEKAQCSLADIIERRGRLSESEAACVVRCVLEGLVTVHSKYFVHRDIKPNNILLFSDALDSLKLADFGVCAEDNGYNCCGGIKGTKGYMAPEILKKEKYGRAVDIWSTGCLTFQLLYGKLPYENGPIKTSVLGSKPKLVFLDSIISISDQAKSFITDLLKEHPENRPTASEALKHPWLILQPQIKTSVDQIISPSKYAPPVNFAPALPVTQQSQSAQPRSIATEPIQQQLFVQPTVQEEQSATAAPPPKRPEIHPENIEGYKEWVKLIPDNGDPVYFYHIPSRVVQWDHPGRTHEPDQEFVGALLNGKGKTREVSFGEVQILGAGEISDELVDESDNYDNDPSSGVGGNIITASPKTVSFQGDNDDDEDEEIPLVHHRKNKKQAAANKVNTAAVINDGSSSLLSTVTLVNPEDAIVSYDGQKRVETVVEHEGDVDVQWLINELLEPNCDIHMLDVNDDDLTDDDVVLLAEALKINKTLLQLTFGPAQVFEKGFAALFDAFTSNHTLQRLYIGNDRYARDDDGYMRLLLPNSPEYLAMDVGDVITAEVESGSARYVEVLVTKENEAVTTTTTTSEKSTLPSDPPVHELQNGVPKPPKNLSSAQNLQNKLENIVRNVSGENEGFSVVEEEMSRLISMKGIVLPEPAASSSIESISRPPVGAEDFIEEDVAGVSFWKKVYVPANTVYYYNVKTLRTRWDSPASEQKSSLSPQPATLSRPAPPAPPKQRTISKSPAPLEVATQSLPLVKSLPISRRPTKAPSTEPAKSASLLDATTAATAAKSRTNSISLSSKPRDTTTRTAVSPIPPPRAGSKAIVAKAVIPGTASRSNSAAVKITKNSSSTTATNFVPPRISSAPQMSTRAKITSRILAQAKTVAITGINGVGNSRASSNTSENSDGLLQVGAATLSPTGSPNVGADDRKILPNTPSPLPSPAVGDIGTIL
ncbi:hypothetical protein HK100_009098 [Physocladia obscura]|uniref:Uncharacterized protein n=1 Tax=Physocladia obscura TaxID=109957 RepID=A0AAD5T3L1_9FUNG|nr:hypothetical protein HK100_009098 [Physocladia obscura]